MKILVFSSLLFGSINLIAQSKKEIGQDLFESLRDEAIILTDDGLIKDNNKIEAFVTKFRSTNGPESVYKMIFAKSVNASLDYEIGVIQTTSGTFHVMFLKTKDDPSGAKIEFLILYKNDDQVDEFTELDIARNEWMRFCNTHQAEELVKHLYTKDAYYYNRGRILQGTMALSAEYSYMNTPEYSLKLTPLHIEFVSPSIAYEIGQCSESYPLPYMILWKKQSNGKWQVKLDTNF